VSRLFRIPTASAATAFCFYGRRMPGPGRSVWRRIALAPTSSQAVELAALLPPETPLDLPCAVAELPPRAQKNLAAVSRALSLVLPDVPPPPPPPAYLAEYEARQPAEAAASTAATPNNDEAAPGGGLADGFDSPRRKQAVSRQQRPSGGAPVEYGKADAARSDGSVWTADMPARAPPVFEDEDPSDAEVDAASMLKQWSVESPHAPVPALALSSVIGSGAPEKLLPAVFPDTLASESVAVALRAIVANCGARVAAALGTAVIAPRLAALTAPAPRDLMNAVVAFAEAHWRAAVPMFSLVSVTADGRGVSGPTAEVLVRVAAALSVQGASDAFRLCCGGVWREEGVPVVEALLARCKAEDGVADALVPALEKNVVGMEKSLRYGKLLFVCTKDVPGIRSTHATSMRSVVSKSTVFLSKRALALLDTYDKSF
jgi:Fanconi Anaemia group E protein FANCE